MTSIIYSVVALLAIGSIEGKRNLNQIYSGGQAPSSWSEQQAPSPTYGQSPPSQYGVTYPSPSIYTSSPPAQVATPPPATYVSSPPIYVATPPPYVATPPPPTYVSSPPPQVATPPPAYTTYGSASPQTNVYTAPTSQQPSESYEYETPLPPSCNTGLPFDDYDIMNFGLQLKCLSAEFYAQAAYGFGLDSSLLGGGPGSYGGKKATLNGPSIQAFARELAETEIRHLRLIRDTLGSRAVQCPLIELTDSFAYIGDLAAQKPLTNPQFTPYSGDITFSLAVYLFSDVSVTAYNGMIPYIQNKELVRVASQISNAQAYEAGAVRMFLGQNVNTMTEYGATAGEITNLISNLRNQPGDGKPRDVGVLNTVTGAPNVINDNHQGLTQYRTPQTIIHMVRRFFPYGLNGYFR